MKELVESKFVSIVLPLVAEFFGMAIFTFTHCSTAHTMVSTPAASVKMNALLPATNDGLTIVALVYALGHISGGHFNFAVTVAVTIGGGLAWWKAPLYLIAQLLGSLTGAALAMLANGVASGYFLVPSTHTAWQAFLMETVITTFLTFTVLMTAVELETGHAALAIGVTIWIGILASFGVSGGCMNPTISFGPAVVYGNWKPSYWVYWAGPIAGACFAGLVFRTLLSKKHNCFIECLMGKAADAVEEAGGTAAELTGLMTEKE